MLRIWKFEPVLVAKVVSTFAGLASAKVPARGLFVAKGSQLEVEIGCA
jgi:hypothetical protein